MKGSRKGPEPTTMLAWRNLSSEDWQPAYPFPADVRGAVTTALAREQRGLCVYCGRKLKFDRPGHTFHIEHFRPRETYEDLATSYDNVFLSCGQFEGGLPSNTCGNRKDNWFNEALAIEPTYPNCTARMKFKTSGEVEAANPADLAAAEMIRRLGLDDGELVAERRQLLLFIDGGELDADDFWSAETGIAESLAHVAFQHLGIVLP